MPAYPKYFGLLTQLLMLPIDVWHQLYILIHLEYFFSFDIRLGDETTHQSRGGLCARRDLLDCLVFCIYPLKKIYLRISRKIQKNRSPKKVIICEMFNLIYLIMIHLNCLQLSQSISYNSSTYTTCIKKAISQSI